MPRSSDARARAVTTTARLLQEQGYAGTGVAQILEVSAAPKGSFYFHFPQGKEQLAAEALRMAGAQVEQTLRRLAADSASPAELVTALVNREVEILVQSGYHRGCPIATVALEMASHSEIIHMTCQEIFTSWVAVLGDAFAGQLGSAARDHAEHVIMTVEGALLLSRVYRDPGPLHRARDALIVCLTNAR